MRIYLAAPWKDRAEMPPIAAKLSGLGHVITHDWWEAESTPEDQRTPSFLREMAELDSEGVKNSELVIVINSAKSEGKAFEQGIAVAHGKPILIVGVRGEHSANVFHYMKNYRWVPDIAAMFDTLDTISWLLKEGA